MKATSSQIEFLVKQKMYYDHISIYFAYWNIVIRDEIVNEATKIILSIYCRHVMNKR